MVLDGRLISASEEERIGEDMNGMIGEKQLNQMNIFMNAKAGDKIELTDGSICEFVQAKRTKFVGLINGKSYSIPETMIVRMVEEAPKVGSQKAAIEKRSKVNSFLCEVKIGDWFFINKNGKALAFKFNGNKGNKVIGINPIDGGKVTIDLTFEFTLIK